MKTRSGMGSLLAGILIAAMSHPAFPHDASKPDGPYHQTDLPELHAIVETVRESAGPEQLARIEQLVTAAGPELQRLSQRATMAHHRKVELMLQDVVDRHAFDEAQANELEAADALSKRIDDALVSLAKTLTPEQRLQFREHNKPHKD
jgi:Spy/CpxP family protein refolding chaperone